MKRKHGEKETQKKKELQQQKQQQQQRAVYSWIVFVGKYLYIQISRRVYIHAIYLYDYCIAHAIYIYRNIYLSIHDIKNITEFLCFSRCHLHTLTHSFNGSQTGHTQSAICLTAGNGGCAWGWVQLGMRNDIIALLCLLRKARSSSANVNTQSSRVCIGCIGQRQQLHPVVSVLTNNKKLLYFYFSCTVLCPVSVCVCV